MELILDVQVRVLVFACLAIVYFVEVVSCVLFVMLFFDFQGGRLVVGGVGGSVGRVPSGLPTSATTYHPLLFFVHFVFRARPSCSFLV